MITLLKNLFKIAKLLSTDDSGDFRFYTVSMMGKTQKILGFMPYGLFGTPPEGSMVNVWNQLGNESNGIGIADDPKNRIIKDTEEGEIGLGNNITGDYIFFDKDGNCTINATTQITVNAPIVDVNATDTVTVDATNLIAMTSPIITLNGNTTINGTLTSASGAGAITLTSATLTHNGTNVGDDHIHSQGNDAHGDVEVDTGGPHS